MTSWQHENFERAFSGRVAGCRRTCACGREFWDAANLGYSWEAGEVESLQADPNATALQYAVGVVEFEGKSFVPDCDCWVPRATLIVRFIQSHATEIAEFLTLEKQRKQRDADRSPVVSA